MNYSRNRYNEQDDFLGPNDVEFPSDENDQYRDRDIENLRPLNLQPTSKASYAPAQQGNMKYKNIIYSAKENFNVFQGFTPGGILKNSQHIQKMQKDSNKFSNNNGSHSHKNPKFQRNNQQPPLFKDEQDQPVEDSKTRLCNSPNRGSNSFSQNNFQTNSQRPPSKFVYSNQNSVNNDLSYQKNNNKPSFNHHSKNNYNRNVPHNNFKINNNSNPYQHRPQNNFQENNRRNKPNNSFPNIKSQSNSNNITPQNNLLNLFGNLFKSNNNSSMTNNDQSNSMALSTIFESVALLQALSNPETLSQTLNLLNTIKNSNPNPVNQPAAAEAFSPDDPSGSEIMGNNVPMIQKENSTHSFSFLETLNKNKKRPEPVNKKQNAEDQGKMTQPPLPEIIKSTHRQNLMNAAEKENEQSSSDINKNQIAAKLELLLSVPSKQKSPKLENNKAEFEEIKTPELSPEKSPMKSPPAKPNIFCPFAKANNSQLLNSQLLSFEDNSQNQPELPKPKLLDFFEDKVQIGGKEKEVEKHQRQYKLLGSDRPLLTQEKNLLEKIERFANEEKKNPEENKPTEQDEKDHDNDDEFNFESRYFMYNPTQVCRRCRKPGHFEKMCTEENIIKCGFCGSNHKMANCDQIVCFKCLKVGHRMQNCQSQHSVTCFRCQKKGHTYHNCGIMMAKDPKTTAVDKQRDMGLIKCSACNQFGHINCKFIKNMHVDDLYRGYSPNGQI